MLGVKMDILRKRQVTMSVGALTIPNPESASLLPYAFNFNHLGSINPPKYRSWKGSGSHRDACI